MPTQVEINFILRGSRKVDINYPVYFGSHYAAVTHYLLSLLLSVRKYINHQMHHVTVSFPIICSDSPQCLSDADVFERIYIISQPGSPQSGHIVPRTCCSSSILQHIIYTYILIFTYVYLYHIYVYF